MLQSRLQAAYLWKDDYKDMLGEIDRKWVVAPLTDHPTLSKLPPPSTTSSSCMVMTTQFNEKVAMNLNFLKVVVGVFIIIIIDMWSRNTISACVNRKIVM